MAGVALDTHAGLAAFAEEELGALPFVLLVFAECLYTFT